MRAHKPALISTSSSPERTTLIGAIGSFVLGTLLRCYSCFFVSGTHLHIRAHKLVLTSLSSFPWKNNFYGSNLNLCYGYPFMMLPWLLCKRKVPFISLITCNYNSYKLWHQTELTFPLTWREHRTLSDLGASSLPLWPGLLLVLDPS